MSHHEIDSMSAAKKFFVAVLLSAFFATSASAECGFSLFSSANSVAPASMARDGLVLHRYAAGVVDSSLIANAQPGVQTFSETISKINTRPSLDVTCKGRVDRTDATIITRHLAGFRDDALTRGLPLVGQRNTAALIQQYLDNACVSPLLCAIGAVPGGLYVGYYQEDAVNNPEDPTIGTLYLRLPQDDGAFSGDMYFTYVGCQTQNIGTISGNKNQLDLVGSWSGTVDNLAQSGNYVGRFQPALGVYQGTYTNAGGKQFRDLRPCITYFIAALGTWELFRLGQTFSPNSTLPSASVSGNIVSWIAPAGTEGCLISAIDLAAAQSGSGNATVWQEIVLGATASATIPTNVLQPGRSYIASVACRASTDQQRNFFSSVTFVYN
jgi:hypothetical protein